MSEKRDWLQIDENEDDDLLSPSPQNVPLRFQFDSAPSNALNTNHQKQSDITPSKPQIDFTFNLNQNKVVNDVKSTAVPCHDSPCNDIPCKEPKCDVDARNIPKTSTNTLTSNQLMTSSTNMTTMPSLGTSTAQHSEEKKNEDVDDELQKMQNHLNTLSVATTKVNADKPFTSGIEPNTQGTITVKQGNREITESHYQSNQYSTFRGMSGILRNELLQCCEIMNYLHPSKIQAEAIPRCLSNNKELKYPNLIGQAHHGSGKTATFSLIMLQRVDENIGLLQGLVVVHSRELAIQTFKVIGDLGEKIKGFKVGLAVPKEKLAADSKKHIIVGTPGTVIHRLFEPQKRSRCGLKGFLKEFRILVVDEADEFLKSQGRGGGRGRGRSGRGRGGGRGRGRGRGGGMSFTENLHFL